MKRILIFLRLFFLLLLVYTLIRIIFFITYFHSRPTEIAELWNVFYWGMRIDLAAVFIINVPFLFYYFLLEKFLPSPIQQPASRILFYLINLPFIALNALDLVYYRYNLRRSNTDIFFSPAASVHSFASLFQTYWWLIVAFLAFCFLFVTTANIFISGKGEYPKENALKRIAQLLVILIPGSILTRGFDNRPLGPSTAMLYVHPSLQPTVNNSTFNFLDSFIRSKSRLAEKKYFSPAELDVIFPIRHQFTSDSIFKKKNVVIFLLESFSASYFENGLKKAHTPFFDSILKKSIVCTNAFENGHESSKGIVATLASIPPLIDEPYYMSNYNTVKFNGIGSILKKEGYSTSFYLGAEYDHFNFAKFCRMVGIDKYYSKESYNQEENDDGIWGVYDEFFFDYFANTISSETGPFFSVLYNISSHPPYSIPPSRKKQFNIRGQNPAQNSISYVDYCFNVLFNKLKREPWFDNTIFIFCSDHSIVKPAKDKRYLHEALRIPLFIFNPGNPIENKINKIVQQTDIVPSILDLLNYPKPFMSFGRSILGKEQGFSISSINGIYQLIDSSTLTGFNYATGKTVYLYDYLNDPSLENNLFSIDPAKTKMQTNFIKAYTQRFNNSLLQNKLLVE